MRTRTLGSCFAGLLATGLLIGTAGSGQASEAAVGVRPAASMQTPAGSAKAAAYPKVYLNTVINQWTHWTPDWYDSTHAGWLYAGSNYFYCIKEGVYYSDNGRKSKYWLLTDDDSGNRNVYVSEVYLDQWGWDNVYSLLDYC
ncbi:hypothetical protein ACQEV9_44760 [Streptomyces chartreusis]|uniref:hypothetical protein n=1 Tax=Streptomyces chartreusis TaxID=1969 RepID=UPI003D9426E0